MSVITNFIKKCKLPILWTIGYIFITWIILHVLFNFELFSANNWIRVSHAHLRGLGGFTFCLIIFALIPLYIATMSIIIRTQQPLLALPMPKFVAKIMEKIFPKKIDDSKNDSDNTTETNQPTNQEIDNFPSEMRGAFIRARTRPTRINAPICSVCSVTPNVYPNDNSTPVQPCNTDDMPLPPDFDIDENTFSMSPESHSTPVFQDIDLYNNDSFTNNDIPSDNPVIEYLRKNNREFSVSDNDIIITDNAAIAVHTDSDFWIMDEPTWFASGKTRESPINTLREIAAKNNIQAILYLGETNIMNFKDKCNEWESAGIHVITKLQDL